MYQSARRTRSKRNLAAFKTLLGTPATEAFTLPAGAELYVRIEDDVDAGTALPSVGGKEFVSREFLTQGPEPVRTAGIQLLGYFERGAQVEPLANFHLLIDTGLGKLRPITAVE